MAQKKTEAQKEPASKKAPKVITPKASKAKSAPAKKSTKKAEPEPTLEGYKAEIEAYIKKYDECAIFNEEAKMVKLANAARESAKKYNALAESEAFQILKAAEDPMKALALTKSFEGIGVREAMDKDTKRAKLTVGPKDMTLDPLRLHNRIRDGIGHDKTWPGKVGRLWDNLVAEAAFRYKLDAKKVRDTIFVGDATKLLKLHAEDKEFGDEMLTGCMQEVLDAMLGPGYEAREDLVQKIKNEVGKTAADVAHAGYVSPDQFRKAFVGILYLTVTGKPVEQEIRGRKR